MFFRKKMPPEASKAPPWDDVTIKRIAQRNQLPIIVTSVSIPYRFGFMAPGIPLTDSNDEDVNGLLEGSKFVHVMINFYDERVPEVTDPRNPPAIGNWFYNVWGSENERRVGAIHIGISDAGRHIRNALATAHRSTLTSGFKYTALTIFKREGDGMFSEKDRQHGYSYESRFPIIGLSFKSRHELATIPKWAVPRLDERFSLDGAPEFIS